MPLDSIPVQTKKDPTVELQRRCMWLLFGRLVSILLILPVILLHEYRRLTFPALRLEIYWILVCMCGLNLLYLFLVRRVRRQILFMGLQIIVDILAISAMVYLTDDASIFVNLYFAPVLAASILVSGRFSIFIASLSTISIASITLMRHIGYTPYPVPIYVGRQVNYDMNFMLSNLLAQGLALHLVAYLSALLSGSLQRINILNEEMLGKMSEGVLIINTKNRIHFVNERAVELIDMNTNSDQLQGRRLDVLSESPLGDRLLSILSIGEDSIEPIITITGEDHPKFIEIQLTKLMDNRDKFCGTMVFFRDYTLHQALIESQKKSERLEVIKNIAANIAHEIRNPLTALHGSAKEVIRSLPDNDPNQKLLNIVDRESERIARIIRDFLEFSKLKPEEKEFFDVSELIREVSEMVSKMSENRMTVRVDAEDGLDCYGARSQIRQVLLNFGMNAIEAMREDRGRLDIRVVSSPFKASRREKKRWMDVDKIVHIRFTDNGTGIPQESRERIFEPFYTTKTTGTGLGLSIAAQIIEEHGGEIDCSSSESGSVFTLQLHGRKRGL